MKKAIALLLCAALLNTLMLVTLHFFVSRIDCRPDMRIDPVLLVVQRLMV